MEGHWVWKKEQGKESFGSFLRGASGKFSRKVQQTLSGISLAPAASFVCSWPNHCQSKWMGLPSDQRSCWGGVWSTPLSPMGCEGSRRFPRNPHQFCDTSLMSCRSIQVCLPGVSIRPPRVRAQSHKTTPTSDVNHKSQAVTCTSG